MYSPEPTLKVNTKRRSTIQKEIPKEHLEQLRLKEKTYPHYSKIEKDEIMKDKDVGRKEEGREKLGEGPSLTSRTYYDLATLQKKPLPNGIDQNKLEYYLNDEDFVTNFNMVCNY